MVYRTMTQKCEVWHVYLSLQNQNALYWSSLTKMFVDKYVNVYSHINIQASRWRVSLNKFTYCQGLREQRRHTMRSIMYGLFLPLPHLIRDKFGPMNYLRRVSIKLLLLVLLKVHSSVNKTKKMIFQS